MALVSSKIYLFYCSFANLLRINLSTQMMGRRDTVCESRLAGRLKEALWNHFLQYRVHWSYRSVENYLDSQTQSCFDIHLDCLLSPRRFASTLLSRLNLLEQSTRTPWCALYGEVYPSYKAILFRS